MPIVRVALDVPLATLFDYEVTDGVTIALGCILVNNPALNVTAQNQGL